MCACDETGRPCPRCRAIDYRDWQILNEPDDKEREQTAANEQRRQRPENEEVRGG